MVRLGNIIFRHRNWIFPLVFLLALIGGQPMRDETASGGASLRIFAAWIVALLGQALRIVTIAFDYIIRGGRAGSVYAEGLVEGGVFAGCRNPLYLGNLLIALGLALVINSAAFYVVFIPFIVVAYISLVAAEERYLREKFGERYVEYCKRTPRWGLNFSKISRQLRQRRPDWRRVVVKEYNTTFALLAALVGLGLWGDYARYGKEVLPDPMTLSLSFAAWCAFYAVVRTAKKRGWLRPRE